MIPRRLLIWLIILWLPAQAFAGQMSLCAHNDESASHSYHHSHAEPHTHSDIPLSAAHNDCPHCSYHLFGTSASADGGEKQELFCDHCSCCQLGGAYAPFTQPLHAPSLYRDGWPSTMAVTIYSHINNPLQRPPQSAI